MTVRPSAPPPPPAHLHLVRVLTGVVIVVALAAAVYFRDRLQELAAYGYMAIFLVGLLSNATIILPIPGLAVSSVMGGVFNPWLVGIVAGIGQALGELSGYLLGYSGQTLLTNRPIYDRLSVWMRRYGVWVVFVLAAIPNPIFDVGGMIAGALRFPIWKFLSSCAAGKIVKNILFALAGYYGIEAIMRLLER
ncbi:MAG: VTT domain-containing protein [Anaerolineae bacterium]